MVCERLTPLSVVKAMLPPRLPATAGEQRDYTTPGAGGQQSTVWATLDTEPPHG